MAQPLVDAGVKAPATERGRRTRARLVTAARKVFEDAGFLDARIADIADRAGLSHGSFYHYFDSKEQVFREVAEVVDAELSAPLAEVILAPSTASPEERIGQAMRLHFERYRDEARIMGVIEQVSRYDHHVNDVRQARHREYAEQIAESIRQLQLRGRADESLDPALTAAALGALTYRFAEMWLVQGAVDCTFDEGVDQVTRIFVNALGLERTRPSA
jgi:AcrR family transcriptional regulator